MARFVITLSDVEREMLEAHRIRLGARSHAEAFRKLIGESNLRHGVPGGERPGRLTMDDIRGKFIPRPKTTKGLK